MMLFEEIRSLLPQKYPFLFIDKVIEFEEGKRIVCVKNVSGNEPVFVGHFPDFAIMPGVLIIEAMAQASIILFRKSLPTKNNRDTVFLLASVNNARFTKPVFPGDQIFIEITVEKIVSKGAIVQAAVAVDEKAVAKATLTFGIADKSSLISS
ncbi:MAG: beta-hydroxyacyl-ACP dehydratase [Candidatus Brocadia sp. AMX2]|uniref:3R-hydroxymyristoyl ACP dehydrase n=1 Tax=Candidatus Brocadia sinica JPN1 TaxID=1197129 RepID=A0ABQ0K3J8_9BACT|nr:MULTISPECIES: 3-hydroxyacyl-ACP dehydratase FabZ [Brocadia]MBC6933751.1 beta-hydroxyacyl-ACP dehydratase [Candidatus Brocadia sp.]MBL1170134.1 beta-hydroxyacyl-ACP dehydratase [Candidatus Brocadia sp. AMX1]MCK6469441.1 3-hydroxyacyl-ACP dehydratase FabZ [Candidatus Brocadia sinica]NOG43058.1 3-hydroxyacyl-ACP dehydratase FabZ [Planctomycetota bacterium]KAA0242921.1 MAG: beta-hydroxyacyl-ACP dehydratase [Candidatus Brocadia sp. AMX2]